ncbi:hypothetical protein ACFE04_009352 [Oxalis oulophora]
MGNLCSTDKPIFVHYSLTGSGNKSEVNDHPLELPIIDKTTGVIRTERMQSPSHFVWKIESFSKLLDAGWDKIESGSFEVDGRKWMLTLYPSGDTNHQGHGHISLYLSLLDTEELPISWELFVKFQFLVLDQIHDKYLVVQDVNEVCRFQRMRTELGFPQLLSLRDFKNSSNGYLLEDCCVFGVDVFVMKAATRGESFSTVKPLTSGNSYTFKIEKFSTIDKEYVESEVFTIQGTKWMLRLFQQDKNNNVALYLFLSSNPQDCNSKVYATCNAKMIDQVNGVQLVTRSEYHFSKEYGFEIFSIPLSDVKDASTGYLVNDTILLKVMFVYLSKVKHFS